MSAYKNGIFPWYNSDDPILWWSPNPRLILIPNELKISRSFSKTLKNREDIFTVNKDFKQVILNCGKNRSGSEETWIDDAMTDSYLDLHRLGIAHSIEIWRSSELIGGLYGLKIGNVFFGESMFSLKRDASKIALFHLCSLAPKTQVKLIDCQVQSSHMLSLGAKLISRDLFIEYIKKLTVSEDHHFFK